MKTLIIALNSKYIHMSLAPWYLKASCGDACGDIKVLEFTINDAPDRILSSIYREKADVAAFSCYIWNISHVLKLAEDLKKTDARIQIALGGPEVSYDAEALLAAHPAVDYVLAGEGEQSFKLLLQHLQDCVSPEEAEGLYYRSGGRIVSNGAFPLVADLDSLSSPYTGEMLAAIGNRIIYFESSRGCPFSCAYCISSTFEGVRYFSMDRVKRELHKLVRAGVRQVKFVDRTFNCSKARAKEIFSFIIEEFSGKAADINFHFEVAADLLDEELLRILSGAPGGLIQLEAGVQTTCARALEAVGRRTSLEAVFKNVVRLREAGNIHLHLDLIAGLPYEDFQTFARSFDEVFSLRPHQLQLGFLKMLKGSRLRREKDRYGYRFRGYPPYEVLYSAYISFDEMLALKGVEELVERYYNSTRFAASLPYLIHRFFSSPFEFFRSFMEFWTEKGYTEQSVSSRELYGRLLAYVEERFPQADTGAVMDLLKLDFLSSDASGNLPEGVKRRMEGGFKERCFDFLKERENILRYLPAFHGTPAKQIFKQVHFELFDYEVSQASPEGAFRKEPALLLFDYSRKDPVTGLYAYQKIGTEDFPINGVVVSQFDSGTDRYDVRL